MIRWPTALAAILVAAFVQNAYGQVGAPEAAKPQAPTSVASDVLHQERSILDALDDYVFQARLAQEAVNIAEENRRISERRARAAVEQLVLAKSRVAETSKQLAVTLRLARTTAPYASGVALVLGGEDPLLTRRSALLDKVSKRQGAELSQYAKDVEEATRAEFIAGIERANAYVAAKFEQDAKARLDTEMVARRALLTRLEQDRALNIRRAKELTQAERALVKEIEARLSDEAAPVRFDQLVGQIPSPLVDGFLQVPFGDIIHPNFGTRTPHPGLTLAYQTTGSRNVRAVAFGRVAWIGRMRGFGTAVVLDHASGFFTVYAGLTKVDVKEGQTVRTGNVLGQVSTPPGDKQANLYFELRQGSDAINPLPYFSKDQIRRHP